MTGFSFFVCSSVRWLAWKSSMALRTTMAVTNALSLRRSSSVGNRVGSPLGDGDTVPRRGGHASSERPKRPRLPDGAARRSTGIGEGNDGRRIMVRRPTVRGLEVQVCRLVSAASQEDGNNGMWQELALWAANYPTAPRPWAHPRPLLWRGAVHTSATEREAF